MSFATFSAELLDCRPRRSGGLIAVRQVDSTELLARRIVDEYAREGDAVPDSEILAWRQIAGRGRHGRRWSSPPGGGVYATLIRSHPDAEWLQLLPLRAALALCDTLNRYLDGRCRVKWPNDLLVGRGKVGGLLVDAVFRGRDAAVVATISFGINHGADLAALGVPRATSLHHETAAAADAAPLPTLARLAIELIAALDAELARADDDDVVGRYRELSVHAPGEVLRCRLDGEVLEGRFLGFDEHGFLRLEVDGAERQVSAGEVLGGD
ncbi:MAG TPA: biotin--[acetyl-CoA-carboxylase] ligase [Thermoanaerobaculia bacterium]|jgi:BirA family biotin operon repressor/biotin-[acetyl-CoA-carboxylase] ligase